MKVFIIAGEKSGDLIGAEIIKELLSQNHIVAGVGGSMMQKSGLQQSLFDISNISIMGFAEVLPKVFKIKKLIKKTVQEIINQNPDAVITIDSPGFNTRVALSLRAKNFQGKLIHVVAPTVWAYKPQRAEKFTKLFDKLFCILPFEPPYFTRHGMDAKYVGYPPLERLQNFTKQPCKKKYILLALGSRRGEIMKHLEFANQIISLIKKEIKDVEFVIPTFPEFINEIKQNVKQATVIITEDDKNFYMERACFGIYKSGTGAVEASICGIPIVIFYKANPISVFILKMMIKIKYANLINIILSKPAIPEFLQSDCTSEKIANKVIYMMQNEKEISNQLSDVKKAIDILKTDKQNFAKIIVDNL